MHDIKFALRQLIKKPGFAAIAILTLGLGIGANTAIFSVINSLLLRMLPVGEPTRLVMFGNARSAGSTDGIPSGRASLFSYPMFRELQKRNTVFADLASMKSLLLGVHGRVKGAQELEKMQVQLVSGSYFPTLRVNPWQGRLLAETDDQTPGGHPVAVASAGWWSKRYGNAAFDPEKTVTIGSTVYSLVGITPPRFFGTKVGELPDLWIPLSMEREVSPGWNGLTNRMFQSLYILGRLKDGVEIPKAQAEVNVLFKRTLTSYAGGDSGTPSRNDLRNIDQARIEVTPAARGSSQLRQQFQEPLLILMCVVLMVLLIACANVANLLLARAMSRQREFAIRIAIGAGRWRLLKQLLTESFVLAVGGAALGLVFAAWAGRAFITMISDSPTPVPLDVDLDLTALAFTSTLAILTTFLFGLAPALRATRLAPSMDLKAKDASSSPGKNTLGRALLAGQVALSICLLGAAGLFLRTLDNLTKLDAGFTKENALLFEVDPSSAGYAEDPKLETAYREIERRLAAVPGIVAASFSFFTFNQGGWTTYITTVNPAVPADRIVSHNVVGEGYLTAMGIPLVAGRNFNSTDIATSKKVAIVNESLAQRYFPGRSAIGEHFHISGNNDPNESREIIGVIKDAKNMGLREEKLAAAYYPYSQRVQFLGNLVVRHKGDSGQVIRDVRRTVAEVDRNLPLSFVRSLAEQVDGSFVEERLTAQISSFFAVLALFLACIGIYGVMSYWVSGQTREIGIRMALGAQQNQVMTMIARQGLDVVVLGVCIGVPAIITLHQVVRTQLYGLEALDPVSIGFSVVFLLASAVLAGFIPARRASKVDPMIALRYE